MKTKQPIVACPHYICPYCGYQNDSLLGNPPDGKTSTCYACDYDFVMPCDATRNLASKLNEEWPGQFTVQTKETSPDANVDIIHCGDAAYGNPYIAVVYVNDANDPASVRVSSVVVVSLIEPVQNGADDTLCSWQLSRYKAVDNRDDSVYAKITGMVRHLVKFDDNDIDEAYLRQFGEN